MTTRPNPLTDAVMAQQKSYKAYFTDAYFVDEMSAQKAMTATQVRDLLQMAGKSTMTGSMDHIVDAQRLLTDSLFTTQIKPGKIGPTADVERTGPSVWSQTVEEAPVYVPAPNDAFPVQVAVTAKLAEVGMGAPRIVNQIVEAVQARRKKEDMQVRDLLETYISYGDVGLHVKITTNATLSKAIVEAVFSEDVERGDYMFDMREMTYDKFEAHQDAVSGAKGR